MTPAGPEVGYARTDRLGHRLRGAPEPTPPERPDAAYGWLRDSWLDQAPRRTS